MAIVLSNQLLEQQVLGIGLVSPLTTDPATGDFATVSGAEDVNQCIRDILSIRVGERVMREDDGSPFPPLVFENAEGLVVVLPKIAVDTIVRYEPRVSRVQATAAIIQLSTIELSIRYVLRATGTPGSLVYPYYLEPAVGGVK
jgi:phage baseplate assembly protein W